MENPTNTSYAPLNTNRASSGIDWAAILAGAVLAAGIGLVLNAFGAALGLATVSADKGEGSINLWIIVTAIWTVVSMILTYMAGGYVAGRLRRRGDGLGADEVNVRDGIHGLVVWALGTIVSAWIAVGVLGSVAAKVGDVAGAAAEGAGNVLASGIETAGQAMQGDSEDPAIGWIGDRLNRPNPAAFGAADADTAELSRQSAAILAEVARTGEITDEDRRFLIAATGRVTGVDAAEAETRTESAITAAQALRAEAESLAATAESEARAAVETARKSAILTAFLVAAASLAAAAAAVAGGVYGGHHRDENRFFAGLGFRR